MAEDLSIQDLQIEHSLEINPANGSLSAAINIPVPKGRNDFAPGLGLRYSTSSRNSIFGLGWNLTGSSYIAIDTSEGLPKYDGSDNYAFNGSISLVPYLVEAGGEWIQKVQENPSHWIYYYRAKNERDFTRFEKWINKVNGKVHWRTRSKEDVLSVFGLEETGLTQIVDAENEHKIFIWLLEAQYDRLGNAIQYNYKKENSDLIDQVLSYESERLKRNELIGYAQKHLQSINYGNTHPVFGDQPEPADNKWLFEVVLDYGEFEDRPFINSQPLPDAKWDLRMDPFSLYNSRFEVRTYRLCKRILLYHHFEELADTSLTGIFTCNYNESTQGSTLSSTTFTGVRRDLISGDYSEKALPALTFNYSAPSIGSSFKASAKESNENLPQGLNHIKTRMVDLFGEGLPGILTESTDAWYYKGNEGDGVFGKQDVVIQKPSQTIGAYSLGDFDQDGNLNLFILEGRTAGYYEYDRDEEKWNGFQPIQNIPHVGGHKFIDLNSNGYADLVVEREDKIICYPSKGKEGFDTPYEFAKPVGDAHSYAPSIGDFLPLDYFQADMTGDGLMDQVQVKNGRVAYYPNLGQGRFGEAVIMEDAPMVDYDNAFDASRIRLHDLTGNGTMDLLYLGRGEISYWYNASGNKFEEGGRITNLPYIDNISSANILDFLGKGTPCLVWSNSLSQSQQSNTHYLELTDGIVPRLLLSLENGMGREVQIEYGYSGLHYLDAKSKGQPWITKIPSHFTVADRQIVIDHISNSQVITEFKYRDGHYNGRERKFSTFGLVERYDTELFENPLADHYTGYSEPSCVKTWMHSGVFGWDARRDKQFYAEDNKQQKIPSQSFENTEALDSDDFQNGYASIAGRTIRQEIFAVDNQGELAIHPYQINQFGFCIRKVQLKTKTNDACFYAYSVEELSSSYEQVAQDPLVTHRLSIQVGKFGDIEKQLSVAYARRADAVEVLPEQSKDYILADLHVFMSVEGQGQYQTSILTESREFEINHIDHPVDKLLERISIAADFDALVAAALDHDESLPALGPSKAKLHSWKRTYFWNDALNDVELHNQIGATILIHHSEAACFRNQGVSDAFDARVTPDILSLPDEGGYNFKDDYWWQPFVISHFNNQNGFYSPERIEREAGNETLFEYDPYFLSVVKTTDPFGNITRGEIDYNVISTYRTIDSNDNITEVLFDGLGMVTAAFNSGEVLDEANAIRPYGNGEISDYTIRNDESFANILDDPNLYLQQASRYLFYDLNSWTDEGKPLRSVMLLRKNLLHNGQGDVDNIAQIQLDIDYQNGIGRTIQTKQKVESGDAIKRNLDGTIAVDAGGEPILDFTVNRWMVSGHTVYNNKQQVVRKFEPFFSANSNFEKDEELETYGISAQNYYDPIGRIFRTDFANSTFTEALISPWQIETFDQNDTVDRSLYKTFREFLPNDAPEKMALDRSLAHKDTSTIVKLDQLGREIVLLENNNDGTQRVVKNTYDINGKVTKITDARNILAFEFKRDMRGRLLYKKSVDSGEVWIFNNKLDQIIHLWDSRSVHTKNEYDKIDRVKTVHVSEALGLNQVTERFVYGEDPTVNLAKERNLLGELVIHYDQGGTQELVSVTPMGKPLVIQRKFLDQFTQEPNWIDPAAVGLLPDTYTSKFTYDSLDRMSTQLFPDQVLREMEYGQGGGLKKLRITTTDGVLTEKEIITGATYNSKGKRESVSLGNGTETTYSYDSETFRMNRLRSRKVIGPQRLYQDINYTYDPVGNLVHLIDNAQQVGAADPKVLQGLTVSSHSEFEYDALYQLTSAKGRVHEALDQNDYRDRSRDLGIPANWGKGTRHIHLNNGATIERYTRNYKYDLSGNIESIKHMATSNIWTKNIWTSGTSNRSIPSVELNGTPIANPENRFDDNGNCIYMPHLRRIEWNYRNNLSKAVVIDRSAVGKPNDEEYYVYGGDGIRIRKITQRVVDVANETIELTEKFYLAGCEIKRVTRGGVEILERITSSLTDGTNSIAKLHTWKKDTQAAETDDIADKKIHYHLSNHLGSTSMEIDEVGDVITYEEYFPFGGSSFIAGRNKRDINLKEYRYSNKERDDFTGLYYFGYRYYSHCIGGWLSPDPIGPEDSVNLYLYVQNNPINLVDPNGLQSTELPETNEPTPNGFNEITPEQHALLTQRTLEAHTTLTAELSSVLSSHFGTGRFAWHTTQDNWVWVNGIAAEGAGVEGLDDDSDSAVDGSPADEVIEEDPPPEIPDESPSDYTEGEDNFCSVDESTDEDSDAQMCVEGDGEDQGTDESSSEEGIPISLVPGQDPYNPTGLTPTRAVRVVIVNTTRPTAGSVVQEARIRVGEPRTFVPGEPLNGTYQLWSNEGGGGLQDAARRNLFFMEDTFAENMAEAAARRLGYGGGRYDPRLDWSHPSFNQTHFNEVWHPSSDALAIRAGLSQTPVGTNGLENWRSPQHTRPNLTVQLSREIPRIQLAGGLMAQFGKVNGIITIVVSEGIENDAVRAIGMTAGALEFAGGSAYLLGVSDLGGMAVGEGYFGATGATRLMTWGSGAMRVGGGVGMIVLSGYSATIHYDQGEYGLIAGDVSSSAGGVGILIGSGPLAAIGVTGMGANYLGDYVEREVTPSYGRGWGVTAGTGAGLGAGAAVGGGLVAFGLVSNPVGWGILIVGGVGGLIGALW